MSQSAPEAAAEKPAEKKQEQTGSSVSARWRIVGWIVLTTAMTLLVVLIGVRSILMAGVDQSANEAILQEAEEFTTFVQEGVDPETAQPFEDMSALMERYLSRQTPATGETFISRAGEEIRVLDNAGGGTGRDFAAQERQVSQLMDSEETSGVLELEGYGEIRWGRVDTDQDASLLILQFVDDAKEEVEREALVLFGVAGVGLLMTAGIAWLVSGRILQPVRRIGDVAAGVDSQDLSRRVPVEGRDDIARTAQAVNEMLDRLEHSYSRQRHFVAQAHHHLAGPLQSGLDSLKGVEDERALEVRRSLRSMAITLHDLELLAEAQTPGFLERSWAPVAPMVHRALRRAVRQHPDRNISLTAQRRGLMLTGVEAEAEVENISADLDADAVRAALLQIIRNAAEHTRDGGSIRLGVELREADAAAQVTEGSEETGAAEQTVIEGTVLRLSVANDGESITAEEARAMLEQFRSDVEPASARDETEGAEEAEVGVAGSAEETAVEYEPLRRRSAEAEVSGMGLGMAVARTVADAHGGSLWVTSGPDQPTVVGMDLPVGRPPQQETEQEVDFGE